MDMFTNTLGWVTALCLGIIILSVFFTLLAYLKRRFSGNQIVQLKGFIKESKRVNVHLAGGRTLENMKFVGFSESSNVKGGIPYQLSNMAVLENVQGLRVLLRADSIRMIEEQESAS